eukprot:CAMPEP_0198561958 /NCGR_PEP_ID=MMETSP1462-20131121/96353_1 /TAXON_ID=1333877 /ORGANISM="Brandtodinium nutriculum, Strain RCC3387" /LENGTH=124 /DNA_ID=CAMNT_0044292873 /DNA_START=20 /DNA_END=391 /DNA_ORIENTATION=-
MAFWIPCASNTDRPAPAVPLFATTAAAWPLALGASGCLQSDSNLAIFSRKPSSSLAMAPFSACALWAPVLASSSSARKAWASSTLLWPSARACSSSDRNASTCGSAPAPPDASACSEKRSAINS